MMTNPEVSLDILQQLESHGLGVSIDDFGTGYSSLSYLKHLPAQELKIDRSFVMNMLEDEKNKSIVKAAIDLAHNLGLSVVAEGIESEEVLQSLVSIGCDFGQGYHIAKPMPEDNFKQWLLDSPMVKHKTA
jgi:EAL domain-containing protein (putative c-di-GMP-specific phosphodiesterase class I)